MGNLQIPEERPDHDRMIYNMDIVPFLLLLDWHALPVCLSDSVCVGSLSLRLTQHPLKEHKNRDRESQNCINQFVKNSRYLSEYLSVSSRPPSLDKLPFFHFLFN